MTNVLVGLVLMMVVKLMTLLVLETYLALGLLGLLLLRERWLMLSAKRVAYSGEWVLFAGFNRVRLGGSKVRKARARCSDPGDGALVSCGTVAVFCTLNHQASVVAHNGHATTSSMLQRVATVRSRLSYPRLHSNLLDLHNRGIDHLVNALQQGNHHGFLNSQDQWKRPLRHDSVVNDLDMQ